MLGTSGAHLEDFAHEAQRLSRVHSGKRATTPPSSGPRSSAGLVSASAQSLRLSTPRSRLPRRSPKPRPPRQVGP